MVIRFDALLNIINVPLVKQMLFLSSQHHLLAWSLEVNVTSR